MTVPRGTFSNRRFGNGYTVPGVDSPRARAQAQLFLCGAVSIEDVSAAELVHRYRLKLATAEQMLVEARERRRNG